MKWNEVMNTSSNKKRVFMSFSLGNTPVEIKELPGQINFSENPKLALLENMLENFTLIELIKLSKMNPRNVLVRRVNEVVRYVNSANVDKIKENKYTINNYLNQYIIEQIMKVMTNPKIATINLVFLLGLQRYIKDLRPLRDLQRLLIRIKKAQQTTGFISKMYQNQIKQYYADVWNSFIHGLELKYFPESKRGILSGDKEVFEDDEALNRIAAFSIKKTEIIDNIEKALVSEEPGTKEYDKVLDLIAGLNLTAQDKIDIKKYSIFGDADLTDAIYEYIMKKDKSIFTDYINKLIDAHYEENNYEYCNFTGLTSYEPGLIWNEERSIAYLNLPNMDCWLRFQLSVNQQNNKITLDIWKINRKVPFKFLGLDDDTVMLYLNDPANKYGTYTYDNYDEAYNKLMDTTNTTALNMTSFSANVKNLSKDKESNQDVPRIDDWKGNLDYYACSVIHTKDDTFSLLLFNDDINKVVEVRPYKNARDTELGDYIKDKPIKIFKFKLNSDIDEIEREILNHYK